MKNSLLLISSERMNLILRQIIMLGFVACELAWSTALICAAPGDLDLSFGNGGKVFLSINQSPSRVRIQPDGKIVTLGYDYWDDSYSVFSRRNADGSPDMTFGNRGYVESDPQFGIIFDFVIQPDGKILGVGERFYGQPERFAVFRFNSNGTPDTGFGTDGVVTPPFNYGPRTAGNGVALQQDGKIVVRGMADTFQGGHFLIVRYHSDGMLDTSFGTNGIVDEAAVGLGEEKILVQPDGRLIVSGWRFITRYNSNGTSDNSFGTDGKVYADVDNMELQADRKIVVITWANQLKRFNPDGTVDASFGVNGFVSITELVPGTAYGASRAFALQKNGKILVAGSRNGTFAISRYNSNGTIDTTFGTNGLAITTLGNNSSYNRISAVTVQPDGNIVAAGYFWPGSYPGNITLVRYLSDAAAERTIGGRVLTPDGRGLRNAIVSITDSLGVRRTVTTSSFGFYSFDDVATGQAYTIAVSSRLYRFATRAIQVDDNLANVDFVGLE